MEVCHRAGPGIVRPGSEGPGESSSTESSGIATDEPDGTLVACA